ncbi:MAG: acyl-CoA dehydrogenase family protein, partial [Bryobacteraceae bacterium]
RTANGKMSPRAEILIPEMPPRVEEFQRALELAEQNADDVDRNARFPSESIDALRSAGALGWGVPAEYGGAGARIEDLSRAAFDLSRRCASTGMIFAMHQIQVACVARHAGNSRWAADYLERVAREQRLIASATSEIGVGGDIRRSIAAIRPVVESNGRGLLQFEKKASTISYGAQADDLLTTVRRNAEADRGDQAMVLTHASQTELKQTSEWDTLGMRGTCSPGFVVRANFLPEQILSDPFATISAETMVPYSHILWSHVWLGIATDAFRRARAFVRDQARQNPGIVSPAALRLSELSVRMAEFRALVDAALKEYASLAGQDRARLSTVGYAVRINELKIAASGAVAHVCESALRVCGVMGYKNGGPYSVGRHLRDAHSATLMIHNDRLHATNAALLLVHREGK